jgi:hypothetical protein
MLAPGKMACAETLRKHASDNCIAIDKEALMLLAKYGANNGFNLIGISKRISLAAQQERRVDLRVAARMVAPGRLAGFYD